MGTYADRALDRLDGMAVPLQGEYQAVLIRAARLFDQRPKRPEAYSKELAMLAGVKLPATRAAIRLLANLHLLSIEMRGAAFVVGPGPALTHERPTEGVMVAHVAGLSMPEARR